MTDEMLAKLAAEAALLGRCNAGGLLELFKVVRRDTEQATARACAELAEGDYFGECTPVGSAIRARFNLPSVSEKRKGEG